MTLKSCAAINNEGHPSKRGALQVIKTELFLWSNEKSPQFFTAAISILVDLIGIEPTTLRMRTSPRNFFQPFRAAFSCFLSVPLHLCLSLTTLFPCGPDRCVVGSVVRNAPQPLSVSFTDRDGERFSCL